MERTTSRRRRLVPIVAGAVFAMLAVLVPAAPAAAATAGIRIQNNCGVQAQVTFFKPGATYASAGGTVAAGTSYVFYLSTSVNWRIVVPRGTTSFTPTPFYTPTYSMC